MILQLIRKVFYRKRGTDGYPLVCVKCGGNKFKQANTDYVQSIPCEYEINCSSCALTNAYFAYGFIEHIYDDHNRNLFAWAMSKFFKIRRKRERQLIIEAEMHPDDDRANAAMKELRERFDSTYSWCLDCDGLVVKERDCCLNRARHED